jgi:ubiquinone/menaquinone biosynthesis C-methylase UbiE
MTTEARLDKGKVPETYRRIASLYDAWAWLTESRARKRCLELAAIQDGESVLEVAVGTGLAFERILEVNPSGRNEGIDLTDAMLARAERRAAQAGHTNYRLRVGDAYALDFAEDSFDVLINNYMFDLLPEPDFPRVLGEFRRVLRACGRWFTGSIRRCLAVVAAFRWSRIWKRRDLYGSSGNTSVRQRFRPRLSPRSSDRLPH